MASAGEDENISLWRKNGQFMGTIPIAGSNTGDNIEVNSSLVLGLYKCGDFLFVDVFWLRRL